ncbi:unnamed protein product [Schistosoma mattheei]|uniref:Uncharacterized protein n=1 Tax=Schistosoma mattheei TaxID=31246 RepID=A0AA85BUP5_9TREM|nr:unnamed protein product [Schistosoma mattheei]
MTTTTMNKPKPIDITNTLISYNVNAISSTSDMMNKSTTQSNRIGTGIPLALITPPTIQHQSYEQNSVFNNNSNSLYHHSNNNVEQLQSTILSNSIIPFTSSNSCNSLNSIPLYPAMSNVMRPVQQQAVPNAITYQLFPTTSITMPTTMLNQNISNSSSLIKPLSKCDIDDLLS